MDRPKKYIYDDLHVPEHWRHYWTKYPEGFTILEALMNWVSQVNGMIDIVNEWQEYLEDFTNKFDDRLQDLVTNILQEWYDEGRFDTIIENAINNRFDDYDAQMKALQTRIINFEIDVQGQIDGLKLDFIKFKQDADAKYVHAGATYIDAADYPSLQAACDAAALTSHKVVVFNRVEWYGEDDYLDLRPRHSGLTIRGSGTINNATGYAVRLGGATVGAPATFNINNEIPDELLCDDTTGFSAGDMLYVVSRRDSTNSTLTDDRWQLGESTPNVKNAYYGEFAFVQEMIYSTRPKLTAGLLFPYYNSGLCYVYKVEPVKDITFDGIKIYNRFASQGSSEIYTYLCHNVNLKNMHIYKKGLGAGITWFMSNECEAYKCTVESDPTLEPPQIYSKNLVKVISSDRCGFDGCTINNTSQGFDFTWSDGYKCTVNPYFINGKGHGHTKNCGTSHGGTYGSRIVNNIFTGCKSDGLSIRARNSIVTGNVVEGDLEQGSTQYGIALYQASAQDCIISNNIITGFHSGVMYLDSGSTRPVEYLGAKIIGNTIRKCGRGVYLKGNANQSATYKHRVIISGNTFGFIAVNFGKAVQIHNINHVLITQNILHDPLKNVSVAAVYITGTAYNIAIHGNEFIDAPLAYSVDPDATNKRVHYSDYFGDVGDTGESAANIRGVGYVG